MAEPPFHEDAKKRFTPFLEELLGSAKEKIHSVQVTGSALTPDYDPKGSDVNSVVVLEEMDLDFLKLLAPLGKKYGKKGIAAPLIMTPAYIENSLDVFPVEFLNIRWVHRTLFGADPFAAIEVERSDLRQQCERELKVRLIGMRQHYLSAAGDRKILLASLLQDFSGYIPLFRAILFLLGKEPPRDRSGVLHEMEAETGRSMEVFRRLLQARREKRRIPLEELNGIFESCYNTTESLGEIIDAMEI